METGHVVRSLRDADYHAGRHLLQYAQEGRLAHREDAPERLYCLGHGEPFEKFYYRICNATSEKALSLFYPITSA